MANDIKNKHNKTKQSAKKSKLKMQPYQDLAKTKLAKTDPGSAIDMVAKARIADRMCGSDFIRYALTDFVELHGDRAYGDDNAITCGIGFLDDLAVTVITLEKGKTTNERIKRNFGSAHPEGYRKALRLMKQAEKFERPVICFVDTSGAYCGIGAEERGQGHAIARNLMEMMTLNTPILSVLTGEGGSGGALGLAVADEVWMMQNSIYSVISPEGCASILYKDEKKSPEAAEALKLTSKNLLSFGIVEQIIPENDKTLSNLKTKILEKLHSLLQLDPAELIKRRYDRFRKIGKYEEKKEILIVN
ncbi:MAG: acetyl-CoA carboxylase carboxyl transferase subunit alpha [Clostridiales bacterium]|jgi:acetyl-CoA carboxylase carboxyl transferase subunit alpha|nr:acetyl-CoA carboxylase carboxyl transferase subunit alpha [Clostridiales bacterium]